jgi:Na+/H+-dicarboxylate symporter
MNGPADRRPGTRRPAGASRLAAREYGVSMEIVVFIALVIAIIFALALSPLARRNGDARKAETPAKARSVDRGKFLR